MLRLELAVCLPSPLQFFSVSLRSNPQLSQGLEQHGAIGAGADSRHQHALFPMGRMPSAAACAAVLHELRWRQRCWQGMGAFVQFAFCCCMHSGEWTGLYDLTKTVHFELTAARGLMVRTNGDAGTRVFRMETVEESGALLVSL